ncbi:hypothetical protein H4R35_001014 [Dimargaris xerosporica]|nr:hypothetical protein H4R35_001014 [Dimargaris xerosporica]
MNLGEPSAATAAPRGQLATSTPIKPSADSDPPSTNAPPTHTPFLLDTRVVLDQAVVHALVQLALADRQFPICGYLGGQRQATEVGQSGADRPTQTLHIQHFYPCPRKLTSLIAGTPEEIPDTISKARHFFASVDALCLGTYQSTTRNATILDPELVDRLKRMHARVPDGICVMVSPMHFSLARLFEMRNILVVYRLLPNESNRYKRRQSTMPVSDPAAAIDPSLPLSRPGSAKSPDRVHAETQTATMVHFAINPQPHPPPGVLDQVNAAYLTTLGELQQVYQLRLDQTTCPLQRTTIHTQFSATLDNIWTRVGMELAHWIQQEYAHLAMAKVCLKSQIAQRLDKLREAWLQGSLVLAHPPASMNSDTDSPAASFDTPLQAAYLRYSQTTRSQPLERTMDPATLDERVYWLDSSMPIEPIKATATRNQQRLKRLDALLASHTPERRKRRGTDGHSSRARPSASGNPNNMGPRSGKSVPTTPKTDKSNGLGSIASSSQLALGVASSAASPLPTNSAPLASSQPGPFEINGTLPPRIAPLPDISSNQHPHMQVPPVEPESEPSGTLESPTGTVRSPTAMNPSNQTDAEPPVKSYSYHRQLPPMGTFDDPMPSSTLSKALPVVTAWSDDQLASRPVTRGALSVVTCSVGAVTLAPTVTAEAIHSRPASPLLRPNRTMHLEPVTMAAAQVPPVLGPPSKGCGESSTNGHC